MERFSAPYETAFEGTAEKLLTELNTFLAARGRRPGIGWPQTARGMSGALRQIAPALRRLEWKVELDKRAPGTGRRVIEFAAPPAS